MNIRPGSPDESRPSLPDARHVPRREAMGSLVLLLVCLAISLSVHAPYLSAFPTNDDIYLQLEIGYVATGRMPLLDFICRDYNGQLFPLSKLLYYTAWRTFGLDVRPAHFAVLAFHALGALGLFQLLRRFGIERPAAAVGAILWSSAALGRWDNPLIWLCAGTIVGGLTWLTIALAAAVGRSVRPQSSHARGRGFCAVLIATSASLASWSVMALLAPLVPWIRRLSAPVHNTTAAVELRAANPTTTNRARSSRLWHLSWLAPLALFGLWQAAAAQGTVPEALTRNGTSSAVAPRVFEALLRAFMLLGQALSGLIAGAADWSPPLAIGVGAALAVALLVATFRADSTSRRVAWLMLAGAWFYLLVAALLRHDVARHEMLAWGRYRYVPSWAWSAVVAVALSPLLRNAGKARRRTFAVAAVVLLAVLVARQFHVAQTTAADFVRLRGPFHNVYRAQQRLLAHLISVAVERQRPLRIAQIPLDLPPVRDVQFPLSNFVALHYPDGTPHVQVVMAERLQPADVQDALAVLHASGNPRAAQWADVLRQVVALQQLVEWLDRFARDSRQPAVLPRDWAVTFSVPFSSGSWSVPLAQFIADGFEKPPPHIVFADASPADHELLLRLAARLRGNQSPQASAWLKMLGTQTVRR